MAILRPMIQNWLVMAPRGRSMGTLLVRAPWLSVVLAVAGSLNFPAADVFCAIPLLNSQNRTVLSPAACHHKCQQTPACRFYTTVPRLAPMPGGRDCLLHASCEHTRPYICATGHGCLPKTYTAAQHHTRVLRNTHKKGRGARLGVPFEINNDEIAQARVRACSRARARTRAHSHTDR